MRLESYEGRKRKMGEGRWWKKDEKMMVVVGIRMKVRDGGRSGGRRRLEVEEEGRPFIF